MEKIISLLSDGKNLLLAGVTWLFEPVLAKVASLFGWLFELVKEDDIPIILSTCIGAAAVVSAIVFFRAIKYDRRCILTTLTIIKSTPHKPEEFYSHYEKIRQELSNKVEGKIKHCWDEFSETLVLPREGDSRNIIHNTHAPEDYFNPQRLRMDYSFFHALPNYFVGVGLLLTFYGLAAALFFTNNAISSGDIDSMQAGLSTLLTAAAFKFTTSLTGLFFSIVLSIFFRAGQASITTKCADVCHEIERRCIYAAPEDIAQLRELTKQNQQIEKLNTTLTFSLEKIDAQTSAIQGLPRGISDAMKETLKSALEPVREDVKTSLNAQTSVIQELPGGISDAMKSTLESAFQPVRKDFQTFADNMKKDNGQAVKGLVGEVSGGIKDALGELPETMQKTAKAISDSQSQIQSIVNSLKEFSTDIASQAEAATSGATGKIQQATENATGSLSNVAKRIQNLVGVIQENLTNPLAEQQQALARLLTEINNCADAMQKAANEHKDATAPLINISDNIREATTNIKNAADSSSTTHQNLQEIQTKITAANERLSKIWENYESRFADVDKSMAATADKMISGNSAYQTGVSEFVGKITNIFKEVLNNLSGAIQELSDIAEELSNHKGKS